MMKVRLFRFVDVYQSLTIIFVSIPMMNNEHLNVLMSIVTNEYPTYTNEYSLIPVNLAQVTE